MPDLPHRPEFSNYLGQRREPLRLPNLSAHLADLNLPEIEPPLGPVGTFLQVPIRLRSKHLGTVYLADKRDGAEFTHEDEQTLTMFASQAALAIANARRHREEQRARADLETLIQHLACGRGRVQGRDGDGGVLQPRSEADRAGAGDGGARA